MKTKTEINELFG